MCRQSDFYIGMKSVNSLVQSIFLTVTVLVFISYGYGLDSLYGALVSFINTWLFDCFMNTQKTGAGAQKSFQMAVKSSVLRMVSLVALILIGLSLLALEPTALILSLVVGQVGFILDRFRQK